ncbi:MAG: NAD-glutamate dehydrogenase domain-containing protein [Myxococcota bacterium]
MTAPIVERVIASVEGDLAPDQRELFATWAERLLAGLESHPLGGDAALAALAAEAFEWVQRREPGEIRVRVRNRLDRPGHTIVEVLQDDRPFILDSLELALSRFDVQERFVVHPIVRADRDSQGQLVHLAPERNGESLESYVYLEFAPPVQDAASLRNLEDHVRQVMAWVAAVTEDHRRMIRAVRELNANLEFAAPAIEQGEVRTERVQSFLDWIIDGRFVLVGMRSYRRGEVDGELEVQIVPGTGLGMWRDDRSSRLFEARRGADVPAEIREDLEDPRIILISKSHMESRIHRAGRLDRILVKEYDDRGELAGFTILVGLFTRRVLRTPGSQIPLLSERLRRLIERLGLTYGSHDHQAIVTAFDSVPVELLVGADVEQLADLLPELVAAASSKAVRLVTRIHPRARSLYAAILIPREHYREDLRADIRRLLEERTGARFIDDRTSFVEEGAATVHCFCTSAEGETIRADLSRLEEDVRQLCSPWEDQLLDALRLAHGDEEARSLAARYEQAFPEALRVATDPRDAVRDVAGLEALASRGRPQFALYFDRDETERETSTLRLYLDEPPLLSDILPVADHFGLQVVDAQLFEVAPADRPEAYVESLRILPLGVDQDDLDALAPRLSDALGATLRGAVPSDALNGLVLGAGLDWRQVDLVRAYIEYFLQVQGALSRPYCWKVLQENPLAVRVLVQWFEARFDPSLGEVERGARDSELREIFQGYRDRISALNEDRALQGVYQLIAATLRTNFFAPRSDPHRIVLKLDPGRLDELSGVVPHREIFVHTAELAGIHLRGGPVARGGLRWSDRHDDLRTEILDLMSTQMLKNGIIVPVGAKGGFVLRRGGLSPTEARALADEQYRVFIASLLDVTDNLSPEGEVVPPAGVLRLDGDDPYLVVAADKGTAHLSDTANAIALERDFWLGDAFASGGSEGYDHKKYAITARGAWECVKHHLAELGLDPDTDTYEVAGIGDMSGDVFGNGLLLMRRAKLVAAFDHRHVFLDPRPDPGSSWAERKRLFELERSTWADYDKGVLSSGGGVWPRGSKRIPIPDVLRERLRLGEHASGQEIVRAILGLDVDLLWNGGIGTYVKAADESHAEVGDRANDAVRIEASELRARIVGEGGNLGLTQAARVEAGLRGVRLDTDAIHNSAGVDLSDHEVNYKIALEPLVRSGRLDAAQRRALLFEVAEGACESVLGHNRGQVLSISLDELRSREDLESFGRAIESLCGHAGVEPSQLDLPDATVLGARAAEGKGLTRPELSVLLGLAKLRIQAELVASDLSGSSYLEPLYRSYFPERFREELPDALESHRLHREIACLCVLNRLVDAGGATLFSSLQAELGVDAAEAASAMLLAEDVMGVTAIRERIVLEGSAARPAIYAALIELDEGVRRVARFLVKSGIDGLDAGRAERWRRDLDGLFDALGEGLAPSEELRLDERRARFEEAGLSQDLARRLASLPLADRGLNILRIAEGISVSPIDAARVYTRFSEQTGLDWVYERLSIAHQGGTLWDRMAVVDLRQELLDLQRATVEHVLGAGPGDAMAALRDYLGGHADSIERIRALRERAASSPTPSALAVIAARFEALRPAPSSAGA